MGTLYTSQSAAGYNSSPPPDDGSQGANNQITWGTTIKAKLADPIKALADAINSQLTTALDLSPRAISTPDSAVASDHWRTLQVTGTTTITLSDAATMTNKYVVGIANLGVGTVTVTRATGANTVNGTAADFTLAPKQAVMLGVNQGATGYNILAHSLSTGAGINTIQASTSVTTPLVLSSTASLAIGTTAGNLLQLSSPNFQPIADLGLNFGSPGNRIANVFTSVIDSGTTGALSLKTNNGTEQVRVVHTSSAVNFLTLSGNSAGNTPIIKADGTDSNIGIAIQGKGTGTHSFYTDIGGAAPIQFQILHTAAANRNITGSNGGNPTISTTAGSLAITPDVVGGGRFYSAGFIGSSVLNAGTLDIPTVSGGAYVVMASSTTGGQGFTGTALNVNGTLTTNSSLSAGATTLGVSGTNMRLTNSSGSTQTYNYCAIRVA
jgi:VCBS repeat-containing protein